MDIREWKNFLVSRYHLKVKHLGVEYHFSPVLTISVGTAIHYLDGISCQPMWFHFPKQCNNAGWIATLVSLNLFYKDYFDYTEDYLKDLNLKRGEMVELYGATAKFVNLINENGVKYVRVEFSQGAIVKVRLENILALKKSRRETVDSVRVYERRRKEVESGKTVVEETLGIDLANNRSVLKSKILVVSGPGKRNSFSRFFKDTLFSDSSLSRICGYGDNLILEKGFTKYAKLISNLESVEEDKRKVIRFVLELAKNKPEVRGILPKRFPENRDLYFVDDSFVRSIKKIREIDPENRKRWTKIVRRIKDIQSRDTFTELQNLKAVIIADIEMAFENSETIKKFLDRGIGVIILSDNSFISHASGERFKDYLRKFPESNRFIWDRGKLAPLISEAGRPLDKEFWLSCRNFFHQEITIIVHNEELADRAYKILEGERLFYQLEGFEKLRNSFREHLRPALFTLKNNIGNYNNEIETADRLFWKFLQDYAQARNMLSESLGEKISLGVDYLDQLIRNIKAGIMPKKEATLRHLSGHLVYEKNFDEAASGEKRLNQRINIIKELKGFRSRVIFPGFPLFEFSNRALIRAATEYYCPEITILSTPWESKVTRSYLEKHLNAVECTDILPEGELWKISFSDRPSERTEVKIIQADETDKVETDESPENFDPEVLWKEISNSTVNEFISSAGSNENDYSVDAFTLYFPGCFSLMKEDHKVLVINEEKAEIMVEERSVGNLERGDKIIFWLNEQQVIKEIIDSMPGREKNFKIMNSWREALLRVFLQYDNDVRAVEQYYRKVLKAHDLEESNLNKGNLLRWKSDDDLMAPHPKNLKLILAGEMLEGSVDLNEKVNGIRKAKSQHQEFKSELQKRLISVIQNKLNEISEKPFVEVEFPGIGKFALELRIIELLSKSFKPQKVRYFDTRKLVFTNI